MPYTFYIKFMEGIIYFNMLLGKNKIINFFSLLTFFLNRAVSLRIKTRILKGLRSFKKCSQSHVRENEFWNE